MKHPSKIAHIGDTIEVMVLDCDPIKRRISLGMKQIEPNPWALIEEKYPVGTKVVGRVKSVTDFGIYIGPYKKYFILLLVMLVLVACALPAFVSPTTSEVDITFNVDQASLKAGECTHLHWDVAGAVLVRLHGKELDKSGEIEICPEKNSAYTLEVNTGSRIEPRELTVAVEGEADQNIPAQTPVEPAAESTDETAEVAAGDTASRLNQLGGKPCPESDFTCVTLKVPYDHFNPDGRTLEVVFGVLPATGERKGMYVTATGGPGSSGLQ